VYKLKDIQDVLYYLTNSELPWGAIPSIALDTGIPVTTLTTWHQIRSQPGGENWTPNCKGHPKKRSFSATQETAIYDHIRDNLINSGIGATRDDIATVATNAFQTLDQQDVQAEKFSASSRFVDGFMERHDLTLRTPHEERRPTENPLFTQIYHSDVAQAKENYPPNRIFNFDETSWAVDSGDRVVAPRGVENVVRLTDQNLKAALTVFATISLQGEKLPLRVLTKGKIEKSLRKLGSHPETLLCLTENGWATEEIILSYLEWLHEYCNQEPCVLVWDLYATHKTDRVKQKARDLDIELIFIPAGQTGTCQPLDHRIFGELKKRAHQEFKRLRALNGLRQIDLDTSIGVLEKT
jgi:hypothetical protein